METKNKTNQYMLGMKAINNFYSMLYQALREVIPTAQLSKNGAYGWRGYQISQFEELTPNQYYFEIYGGDPFAFASEDGSAIDAFTPRELIFQEAYQDNSHQPVDDYEKRMRIKTGNYYYPFQVSLDLYRTRFFYMNIGEQYNLLKNFGLYAVQQALIWQKSDSRKRFTNPEFLDGNETEGEQQKAKEFERVTMDFLFIWQQEGLLFNILKQRLYDHLPQILNKKVEWVRENAHPRNFDFRGLRVKFPDSDSADFLWAIFYENPEILGCYYMEDKKLINTFNIEANNFFDLETSEQMDKMTAFINKCMKA